MLTNFIVFAALLGDLTWGFKDAALVVYKRAFDAKSRGRT